MEEIRFSVISAGDLQVFLVIKFSEKRRTAIIKALKRQRSGDHVRYGHHSVVIVEKHVGYIIVAEANYGHTCMINGADKISKSALNGATYYTRY